MATGCGINARLRAFRSLLVLSALALRSGQAAETAVPVGVAPNLPREVELRRETVPYEVEGVYWLLDRTNTPFLKEPGLSKVRVFRSVLQFGKDTNNAFALIWDKPKGKLYLDLNQNRDLTDDPAGVFSPTNTASKAFTCFENVTLPMRGATSRFPALVDLYMMLEETNRLRVWLDLHSLWQAKVGPPGEEWQMAAVDDLFNPAGPAAAQFLLLRPWAARADEVLRTNAASGQDLGSGVIPFPDHLFWLGQAFHLERHFVSEGESPVCKVGLAPEQPPLVDLKVSGKSLYYAVLRDTNGYTVVLREPRGTVKVPQGIYTVSAVWVKAGATTARRFGGQPLVVNATVATSLVLGGPLTNSVVLNRNGRRLDIDYRLGGADGGAYYLAGQDRNHFRPVQFAVYYGGKKLLSGRFAFG